MSEAATLNPPPDEGDRSHSRRARPRSVTIVSWIFIAIGAVTLVVGLLPSVTSATGGTHRHTLLELSLICLVRIVAIVSGVFILFGHNWARLLILVWVAFHLEIASLHSVFALLVHVALFGLLVFLLFRPAASAYFRSR